MTADVTNLLERSSAEAIRAIQASDPRAAAAHDELCLRYASRAMAAMIERRVAFPFDRAA